MQKESISNRGGGVGGGGGIMYMGKLRWLRFITEKIKGVVVWTV